MPVPPARRVYTRAELFALRPVRAPTPAPHLLAALGPVASAGAAQRWDRRAVDTRAGPEEPQFPPGIPRGEAQPTEPVSIPPRGQGYRQLTRDFHTPQEAAFSGTSQGSGGVLRASPPPLVPVDAAWLRPHPMLDGAASSAEPLEPRKASAPVRIPAKPAVPRSSPERSPSGSVGSAPPGFGPLQSKAQSASPHILPKFTSAATREAYFKSRHAKGPDLAVNFASRIAYRRAHPAASAPVARIARCVSNGALAPETQLSSEIDRLFSSVAATPRPGPSEPPTPGSLSHELARMIRESKKAPSVSKARVAPVSHAAEPKVVSDAMDMQGLRVSAEATSLSNAFDALRDRPVENVEMMSNSTSDMQSRGNDTRSSHAARAVKKNDLAPSVLSFFDSVRAQAVVGAVPSYKQAEDVRPFVTPATPSKPNVLRHSAIEQEIGRRHAGGENSTAPLQSANVTQFFQMFNGSGGGAPPVMPVVKPGSVMPGSVVQTQGLGLREESVSGGPLRAREQQSSTLAHPADEESDAGGLERWFAALSSGRPAAS